MTQNSTLIPAPRVPFIDERTGLMAREWYRFFVNLFTLTGSGTSDTSITDLAVAPIPADNSQNLSQATQLAYLMAQYDQAANAIQGAYVAPVALPNDGPFDPSSFGAPRVEVGTLAAQNADNVSVGNFSASGSMKFGTHTAIGAETLTGFITITDSGGTTRKLGVVS